MEERAGTPTPWSYEKILDEIPYDWRVKDQRGDQIAIVDDWVADRGDSAEGKANADLIVRAVNAHWTVVEALEGTARRQLDDGTLCWCDFGEDSIPNDADIEHWNDCLAARAALALAKTP